MIPPRSSPDLLETLDLTETDPDHFVAGHVARHETHLFGGQVLAQAMIAAGPHR